MERVALNVLDLMIIDGIEEAVSAVRSVAGPILAVSIVRGGRIGRVSTVRGIGQF